eukprot:CAMPEP_0183471962 /NCGR_PEP_ID=MMETSP0370-20130417/158701_1 /TAXON_ID=268820 /ORGANISM="Peridinium aciculiferum, Strain PAER-2" /LENGTH=104 /DNA_ID=CAMNT_0025664567 /DNA_START=6 /DNA_END=317 /DNA_ORIENTATION=-
MKAAGLMHSVQKQYHDGTKGKQGHGQGLSDHWSFLALLQVTLEYFPVDSEEHKKCVEVIGMLVAPKAFRFKLFACRILDAYGQNNSEIEVSVEHEWKPLFDIII